VRYEKIFRSNSYWHTWCFTLKPTSKGGGYCFAYVGPSILTTAQEVPVFTNDNFATDQPVIGHEWKIPEKVNRINFMYFGSNALESASTTDAIRNILVEDIW
jgi:hypothetical protein